MADLALRGFDGQYAKDAAALLGLPLWPWGHAPFHNSWKIGKNGDAEKEAYALMCFAASVLTIEEPEKRTCVVSRFSTFETGCAGAKKMPGPNSSHCLQSMTSRVVTKKITTIDRA